MAKVILKAHGIQQLFISDIRHAPTWDIQSLCCPSCAADTKSSAMASKSSTVKPRPTPMAMLG